MKEAPLLGLSPVRREKGSVPTGLIPHTGRQNTLLLVFQLTLDNTMGVDVRRMYGNQGRYWPWLRASHYAFRRR
jgi:hypothetical protein